jgi:hypothetical protein
MQKTIQVRGKGSETMKFKVGVVDPDFAEWLFYECIEESVHKAHPEFEFFLLNKERRRKHEP